MKIGDRVYVHGFVDEIRKDCVIIRNEGGYFGTVKSEIVEAQKTEDIVSVVRCKVCLKKKICLLYRDTHDENGFCAWAERKDNG